MYRLSILAAGLVLWTGSTASAQVSVRAPFVRVEVGPGGTYVRAPFVRYYAGPPIYVTPPPVVVSPGITIGPNITVSPPLSVPQAAPQAQEPPLAAPAPPPAPVLAPAMPRAVKPLAADGLPPPAFGAVKDPAFAPPAPGFVPPAPAKEMALEKFAKSFQAKEGNYEVVLTNPVSKMPTTVRFALPPGVPEVAVGPASITYRYAGRSMVKIEFDADGATVISR
jgi:hypothetical protein